LVSWPRVAAQPLESARSSGTRARCTALWRRPSSPIQHRKWVPFC